MNNTPATKQKLLMQEKGMGFIISTTLLAKVPELVLVTHQQISAIVGVVTYCQDSGSFKEHRHLQGG